MDRGVEILIVEDSPTQAAQLRFILERNGYSVVVANNGRQALSVMNERTPTLVISDIVMPEMDGYELCRKIKNDDRLKEIPVLLLTSLSDPIDIIRGLECGADNFLTKPYDEKPLLSRIKYILLNREVRRGERTQLSMEVFFGGQKFLITPERQQILDLLISTYEMAVHKNLALVQVQEELRALNESLEEKVEERTAALRAEVVERQRAEESLRRRDAILEAVGLAAEHFLRTRDWEQNIKEILAQLGSAASVSRVYIFENHAGPNNTPLTSQRYEWVAQGITSEISNPELQNLDLQAAGFARWQETLSQGGYIHGPVSGFPPAEQGFLSSQNIRSLLVVPIFVDEEWWGLIGFDECLAEREWSAAETDALRTAANTLGAAIQHKRAEEALQRTEEQLRQSQKLEAIGKLAGGVAHDFNNLLTVINGYSDVLLRELRDESLSQKAEEIRKAGKRAATLTRQLLAFSRKQVLQPTVLNLNNVVPDMDKMLRRMIGEDIDLLTVLEPELGQVKADYGQLEQVLMNLVVNARDAMPQGGRLTIQTANVYLDESYARHHVGVQTGHYVMLAVSDTGCGMDAETKAHIFEPFFTTKEPGKGTGLGLSTVYGIVKQSGGNIWVYSEVGRGTTFKVYLPRANEAVESHAPNVIPAATPQGFETVLLLEDEEVVRRLAKDVLELNGYQVLVASGGSEALSLCEQHQGPIHLLITDVVMPQMGGREVAEQAATLRPGMKVLYMSGYTGETIVHHGVLDPGVAFLEKPFTPDAMARKVREVLDAPRESACLMAGVERS